MAKVYEGNLSAKGLKVALIVSRVNEFITGKLESGALDALRRNGVSEDDLSIFRCPGAFEIPYVASKLAESKLYDAVICLGAVIRGATPHNVYICSEVSKGIAQISLSSGIPILFGVLTTDNVDQAIERAGTKAGNKGFEAAMGAIELANLYRVIPS